jgi:hypothetical protein
MKTLIKEQPTKRAIKLLDFALNNKASFTTGAPTKVLKYGVYADNKVSFVTFETEGGIEDIYNHEDCLAMAMQDSAKIITFNLK